ncbi:RsmB/NOP family class I SAM-dependent RNA methyltransferase [Roseovarius sp. A21]|uniref:RsmB/NOP family class I SAM-dependent RNA methyltransferase n=1 Tax=Roseovarius bejariae TaxID=2576383 RepID=A0A844D0T0_9RHOB|nr:RsmB/NOP family class I SAM-dependent RNA methyltransferase [Roseovarius bejariae]MRU16926.1 RsmB/NOP family class I SAM-dependent RNA methyltransferase [Roseovarius bejariae]
MTPGARIQASAEILDEILAGVPAEKALTGWARRSRFAGSKDRAAVRDHVFQALRCRRSYACLGGGETGRALMLGALRAGGRDPAEVFTGEGHSPAVLSDAEQAAGQAPETLGDRFDLPDWMIPHFEGALGAKWCAAAQALTGRAPVVLRVNLRKATVAVALAALAEDGVEAKPAEIADTALVVCAGARRVAASRAYREGLIELQDGSSQAAMECLAVPPGARVLDYCAGGGGKVLALAARAEAEWFAHDAAPARMRDLPDRARRAGVCVTLLEEAVKAGSFDLVLCDVPCSGSGTWRRTPDAKWRMTPERLSELTEVQAAILDRAAGLVTPGGRLAYATCSLFCEENEAQVEAFVRRQPDWRLATQRHWTVSDQGDGFFLAIFER